MVPRRRRCLAALSAVVVLSVLETVSRGWPRVGRRANNAHVLSTCWKLAKGSREDRSLARPMCARPSLRQCAELGDSRSHWETCSMVTGEIGTKLLLSNVSQLGRYVQFWRTAGSSLIRIRGHCTNAQKDTDRKMKEDAPNASSLIIPPRRRDGSPSF